MQGIIVAKSFNQFVVYSLKRTYTCLIRKTLRQQYVPWPGDTVTFDPVQLIIEDIKPHFKLLERPRIANLEQLFVVMSMVEPLFSWPLVYRYLSYANYHEVKSLLVISKIDKVTLPFSPAFERQLAYLNIPVIYVAKGKDRGVEDIKLRLPGTISAFAGQTGVGKSTIINRLSPDYEQTIGSYSRALGRGRHQTKQVILFPYADGFIADTPGFSSLELNFGQDMLAQVFPGFKNQALTCKFPNCLHQAESGCAITNDVRNGKIPLETYQAYLDMLGQLPFRKDHY